VGVQADAAGDAGSRCRGTGTTTVDALLGRMTLEQKVGQVMSRIRRDGLDAGVREMIESTGWAA